jgi:hypothetical protein
MIAVLHQRCTRCQRGAEACGYCEGTEFQDWEAICDCGLADFGSHLTRCEARSDYRYVMASDHEQAKILLAGTPSEDA